MAAFRSSTRCLKDMATYSSKLRQQTIRQRLAAEGRKPERSSKIPVIPHCPAPTCECAEMPPDLDIEMSRDLNGTMAAYSEQIIVSTGQADWKSRIEDEQDTASWGSVIAQVKELLGPKGHFHDPYRNTVVSASSFVPAATDSSTNSQVLLFPSFCVVDNLDSKRENVQEFIRETVVARSTKTESQKISESSSGQDYTIRPISTPTILVCSHLSRDNRCGVLGPLLHAEFSQYINKRHSLRNQVISEDVTKDATSKPEIRSYASHPTFQSEAIDGQNDDQHPINIGMISHIGGHKWAGNVIVYIPPDYKLGAIEREKRGAKPTDKVVAGNTNSMQVPEDQPLLQEEKTAGISPLAGKGIWYGRVQPKHVEGIVEQTIGHGQIIKDLFRGGINQDGSMIRL